MRERHDPSLHKSPTAHQTVYQISILVNTPESASKASAAADVKSMSTGGMRGIVHGLEGTRGQDRTCGRTGNEHAADVRDDAGGGDHACANGRRETVGGHDGGATGCEDGTAASR